MSKITLCLLNHKLNAIYEALEIAGFSSAHWPAKNAARGTAEQLSPTAKQLLIWLKSKAPLHGTARELHTQYPIKMPLRAFATTLGILRARNDIPGFIQRQVPVRNAPAVWTIETPSHPAPPAPSNPAT